MAVDITTAFRDGEPRTLRGRVWWAKVILGAVLGGAGWLGGVVSGVKDGLDLLGDEDANAEDFDAEILSMAKEAYDTVCVVVDLSDDELRPSARSDETSGEPRVPGSIGDATAEGGSGSVVLGRAEGTLGPRTSSVDAHAETATARGEALPPSVTLGPAVETDAAQPIDVQVEPAQLDLSGVDVAANVASAAADVPTSDATASPAALAVRVSTPRVNAAATTLEVDSVRHEHRVDHVELGVDDPDGTNRRST